MNTNEEVIASTLKANETHISGIDVVLTSKEYEMVCSFFANEVAKNGSELFGAYGIFTNRDIFFSEIHETWKYEYRDAVNFKTFKEKIEPLGQGEFVRLLKICLVDKADVRTLAYLYLTFDGWDFRSKNNLL